MTGSSTTGPVTSGAVTTGAIGRMLAGYGTGAIARDLGFGRRRGHRRAPATVDGWVDPLGGNDLHRGLRRCTVAAGAGASEM